MDNLLILITTCKGYFEKNIDNLLDQINKYNIPKKIYYLYLVKRQR